MQRVNENKTVHGLYSNVGYIKKLCDILGYEYDMYLDSGTSGYAYLLKDNKVLKITTDVNEFLVANRLKGKKLKRISDVYKTYKLSKSDAYIIVLEYIDSLSDELMDILEEWTDEIDYDNKLEVYVKSEIDEIQKELKLNGIADPYDYKWWMNMGMKNGRLAVFDVGDKSIVYDDYPTLDIEF